MNVETKFAQKIASGDFILTAEYNPGPTAAGSATETALKALGSKPVVINMADNQHGVAMSSLAASLGALKCGVEPVLQMVTRDRNRIALQSDLLGAASLGIKNVLCLSGHHQTLINCPDSANVYDIDSTQFIELTSRMSEKGLLADGTKIEGSFAMLVGAVANPFLRPMELNILRLTQKIEAGARFIQTHPVFDLKAFSEWLEAARAAGLHKKAAIIASVFPLSSAEEGAKLRSTYADFTLPDDILAGFKASSQNGQKSGVSLCVETIKKLKPMEGLRGIHILSGGKEALVPEILAGAGF